MGRASGVGAEVASASTSPRVDRSVTLHDGRQMAYAEWGRPDGRPVVLLHGMPGSRLLCPDDVANVDAGVRLITIDRPGYGRSSPNAGRSMLDWIGDYGEWFQMVGLAPCPIVGWSAGGPYALACAARCPELVTSVGLAASTAPLDEVPSRWDSMSVEVRVLIELLRTDAAAATERIAARCAWFATDWASVLEPGWGSADDAVLTEQDVVDTFLAGMAEAARQGTSGYVEDWIADSLPWGFSATEVTQDTHIWWGDDDQTVLRPCADYFKRAIPRSTLTVLADEGHLFAIRHWQAMLTALA
jgi:pimeloyl-ACP methyl ester carboxylesterase